MRSWTYRRFRADHATKTGRRDHRYVDDLIACGDTLSLLACFLDVGQARKPFAQLNTFRFRVLGALLADALLEKDDFLLSSSEIDRGLRATPRAGTFAGRTMMFPDARGSADVQPAAAACDTHGRLAQGD